jgi:hypothetical protein
LIFHFIVKLSVVKYDVDENVLHGQVPVLMHESWAPGHLEVCIMSRALSKLHKVPVGFTGRSKIVGPSMELGSCHPSGI